MSEKEMKLTLILYGISILFLVSYISKNNQLLKEEILYQYLVDQLDIRYETPRAHP